MSRVRRRRAPVDRQALIDLAWWQLCELVDRDELTWVEVNAVTRAQVLRRHGGDPYAHLRQEAP